MPEANSSSPNFRQFPLALVRIVIGWHFLYEGVVKLVDPGWTSAGYLSASTGPLAGLFRAIASGGSIGVVDQLNIWGLLLIGLALMLGVLVRPVAIAGVVLLGLYYSAYPPLFAPGASGVAEGSYLIVNKTLVELFTLAVIVAYPASSWGLGSLLGRVSREATRIGRRNSERDKLVPVNLQHSSRRELFAAMAGVPFLGGFLLAVLKKHGWHSFEEIQLARAPGIDGTSGATIKRFQFSTIADLRGQVSTARIGGVEFSRMILGGNLIGGWSHARDLIYVSQLVKAYHHREKIFETFHIAEQCGINAVLTNPALCGVINDYWRHGGKIRFISDCGGGDPLTMIQKSIDNGASSCYIQGAMADDLVAAGDYDTIARGLELIRCNGLPAGIGAHSIQTVKGPVEQGIRPDFWMKTLHRHDYWSAKPAEFHDNRWCYEPDETIAYMNQLPEPWIAFKILGAGAIEPEVGFRYAFESGADLICVGMYDFQIVDDVNLCCSILAGDIPRQRPWRA